jgi:exopolysaccharide biosynthesis protein
MHWSGFLHMRHPRSALGWNKDYIFLVEVDGRQSNISLGMTFPELADYLIKLGCSEAMNLDGGGSATLWALGSVRNSPSEGDERPSANALVVVRKTPNPSEK